MASRSNCLKNSRCVAKGVTMLYGLMTARRFEAVAATSVEELSAKTECQKNGIQTSQRQRWVDRRAWLFIEYGQPATTSLRRQQGTRQCANDDSVVA